MPDLSPEEIIQRGDAVQRFLNDGTVQSIFTQIAETYFTQWMAADTLEARELLWAKARALDDLVTAVKAVANSGEHEKAMSARATRPA